MSQSNVHNHNKHRDEHAHHEIMNHEHEKHSHSEHNNREQHSNHNHGGHGNHHAHMIADFRKRFWISLLLTLPILVLSPMIQSFLGIEQILDFAGDLFVSFLFSTIVFVYGGWPFLKGFFKEIKDRPGMMTLISLAISVAYFYSAAVVFGVTGKVFFWELATLIDIMLLGHWIEMKSVAGASRALEELAKLMPSEAHKLMEDGSIKDVGLDELKTGDRLIVKPGEKIPADANVVEGSTSVNEAMITGESTPVTREKGDKVIGGSVNGEGSLTIKVEKTGKDSFLSQVVELVQQAQQSKSKTQDLANKAAFWLTLAAITAGMVTMGIWLFVFDREFVFALERTVTVMVITCPHALGLAIPLVVAVSTTVSAQNGLLIRNRSAFEKARNLNAIVFDKTGTLTQGSFGVTDTVMFNQDFSDKELLKFAAAVEQHSEHPIAKGVLDAVDNPPSVSDFKSIPGKGVTGKVENKEIMVVSPGYLTEKNIEYDNNKVDALNEQGKTVIYVIVDNNLMGAIALSDIIRPESKEAVSRLKKMGIKAMMLTGDNDKVAAHVASELGLDEYYSGVLPDEKANKIKEIQSRGMIVAMTGDGVNDAPALAQSDVGIAIGAGTDVAVETADIVLVRSNPQDAVDIVSLARATFRKMVQNLIWATGYNIIAIPLAAGILYPLGFLPSPAIGAVFMSLSTVIVSINARFLKIEQ